MMRWFYKYFAHSQWARQKLGGKWERIGGRWEKVQEWSSPQTRPDLYGTGSVPDREDWSNG